VRGIKPRRRQCPTQILAAMSVAKGVNFREIRNTARGNQHSEAAIGKTERADPFSIQPLMLRPIVQHVTDKNSELFWPEPKLQHLPLIVICVASMTNGRSYKAGTS
jgi:hypothetical protein